MSEEVAEMHGGYLLYGSWKIEEYFDKEYWRLSFQTYWTISIILSIFYCIGLRVGTQWMKTRDRFLLKLSLTFWNVGLALFSIVATIRILPQVIHINEEAGWIHKTVCERDSGNVTIGFWELLFTLSKVIELGDTVFVVLRKQTLLFLHWYHHITVLCYTWYTYQNAPSTAIGFGVMNYIVHSFMYSYYALKTIRVHIPQSVSMMITFLQLMQMLLGVAINAYSGYAKHVLNTNCDVLTEHLLLGLLMYASYLILFGNFFFTNYFTKLKLKAY